MNILLLTGNLGIGGTELMALDYAQSIKKKGHNVYWATIKDGPIRNDVIKEGIELQYCAFQPRTALHFFCAMKQLKNICKEKKIQLIHAIDAYTTVVAVMANRNIKNKPKLIWSNVGIGTKSYYFMQKLCESQLDFIITPSNFIRNRMIEESFSPEKIIVYVQSRKMIDSVINRNVIRKEFGIDENDFVIGTIGRVVKMKGNRTIVLAMQKIIKRFTNIKLVIVGDGPERIELEQLAKSLNVYENIIFTGFLTNIEDMYQMFDMVAFPTYYEALGYIPFEAMYYEKPIIASLTGGIPEIVINGYNGILVPPAMVEEWEDAIIKLFEDEILYNQLKSNGKNYYNEYLAHDNTNEAIEKIYMRVLNKNMYDEENSNCKSNI